MCLCPHMPGEDSEDFENKVLSAESKGIIRLQLERTKNILRDKQANARAFSSDLKSLQIEIEELEKKIVAFYQL